MSSPPLVLQQQEDDYQLLNDDNDNDDNGAGDVLANVDGDGVQATTTFTSTTTATSTTKVLHTPDGAPYVICESKDAFVNPTSSLERQPSSVQQIVNQLNVDLGQKLITRQNRTLLWILKFLDAILFQWWEHVFFYLYNKVPLKIRRAITFSSWKVYLKLHKMLLGKTTGLHPTQSEEYHALTTIAWWSRFFPCTPQRMRFSLSQLHVCMPNTVSTDTVQHINEDISSSNLLLNQPQSPPTNSTDSYPTTVRGLYLRRKKTKKSNSEYVLFWIYGGAYLAGDTTGNSAAADWFSSKCDDVDVFIPEFRLAPQANIHEVMWDVSLAYCWLCHERKSIGMDPSKIVLLGISSGAAIGVRLMQYIAEHQQRHETLVPPFIVETVRDVSMPEAAVLFGPYVDFTTEDEDYDKSNSSFHHYSRLDLVVTESVQEYGLPYLDEFIPDGKSKVEYSPVYRNMKGLPPLCVIVSEHEAVYDMTIELVNRARAADVEVTLGVWKYMCHVFSFFFAFVPEGELSMLFASNWLRNRMAA